MILSILLSTIFFILGLLHLNWVVGGKFGLADSLPTNGAGEKVLNPRKIDSAIVGLALMSFGVVYLLRGGVLDLNEPDWILTYGGWIIPIIFFMRAVGEFKYVGFFKRVRGTRFGRMDTKYFSPLCLIIAIIGILLQIVK